MGLRNLPVIIVAFVVGLGGGAGLGYYYFAKSAAAQTGETSASKNGTPPAQIGGRGRLEPEGGVINLAASGPDVLQKLLVHEGDVVEMNQELAILGSRTARQIELDLANAQRVEAKETREKALDHLKAQQKESRAHIDELKKQAPRDLEMQEAKIKVLERQAASAKDLVERMRKAGGYPEQEVNQQELARVQAEQELEGARSLLSKIRDANEAVTELPKLRTMSSSMISSGPQARIRLFPCKKMWIWPPNG